MLQQEHVNEQEEALREAVRSLTDEQRKAYFKAFNRQLKDPDTYASLNYFFITGLHHFYLGRWLAGLFDLGVFIAGVVLIIIGQWQLGVGMIVVMSLLELWALFRAQVIVQDYNNRISRQILNELRQAATGENG
jgi:hypothetical protein